MFISRSMASKVITLNGNESIFEAKRLMADHHIRHIPIVAEDGRLEGIVTDRDIRSALPRSFFKGGETPVEKDAHANIRVRDIMTADPITVSPSHTIQDALLLIEQKRVGAFPVVDGDGKLVGIISVRDLLRAFVNVLGIGQPGTLLGILVEEKVGQLKRIVDAITEMNISFGSVLVARYWETDKRAVFLYLHTVNIGPVKRKLKEIGFQLLDPMHWYLDQLPSTVNKRQAASES